MRIQKLGKTIQYTNDGGLSLFFLGTGSAFATKYFQNNLLVIKGKDHVLIDCGVTCSSAFRACNASLHDIENLIITHSHADHIGCLEEVALSGKYISKRKPKIIITDEYKQILWDKSLSGGCAYGEGTDGPELTFDDFFEQVKPVEIPGAPRPAYEAQIGSINIKLFRTYHVPNKNRSWDNAFYSVGVLIDNRVLFTGDCTFDKPLLDWMEEAYHPEYIFHDCQLYEGGVHAFYGDLKSLPESMRKKMYLCHYGDNAAKYTPEKDGFAGFAKQAVYYHLDK